jgi:D-glycero-D-manno-heptose 1,7-bisphosphate phosphatase
LKAVFLDRDGVLIEDGGLLVDPAGIRLLPDVPQALVQLKMAGFRLVVVSNQTVVARGLLDEDGVRRIEAAVETQLRDGGGPNLDGFYFCPHHPQADVPAYRRVCACRKPAPGMLLRAAAEQGLELPSCFMVGDRPSDVAAGAKAGCRTVLVQTGRHADRPIAGVSEADLAVAPDFVCAGLPEAAAWIVAAAVPASPRHGGTAALRQVRMFGHGQAVR